MLYIGSLSALYIEDLYTVLIRALSLYIYMYVCVYIYVYMYIYIYMYTYASFV